jgi:hypothetical protein
MDVVVKISDVVGEVDVYVKQCSNEIDAHCAFFEDEIANGLLY